MKKKWKNKKKDTDYDFMSHATQSQEQAPIVDAIELESCTHLDTAGSESELEDPEVHCSLCLAAQPVESSGESRSRDRQSGTGEISAELLDSCPHCTREDRNRRKKRISKKAFRKAGWRVWRGCVVAWKYFKSGLTLYVGTPAGGLNIPGAMAQHMARKEEKARENMSDSYKYVYTPYTSQGQPKRKF